MDEVTNSRLLDMKEYAQKAISLLGELSYAEFNEDMRITLRTIYDIVHSELPTLINQIDKITGET